jgi:phosphoglycerate kinase
MKSIRDFDLENKKVLIRVDFNVPLDNHGHVKDDTRIRKALPTINYVLEKGGSVILMSHLGRPNGKVVPELRLDPVAHSLSYMITEHVVKLNDCVDIFVPNAKLVLLENLRFYKEEKEDNEEFAKKLASLADIYVNDAFAVCHRKHASVHTITEFIPSCAGFLLEKEIEMLSLKKIKRPFVAILGGAKISTKIGVIENLLKKVDYLLLGGAMIFTFYKAKGLEIGKSLYEKNEVKNAKSLLKNKKIILPKDIVVANEIKENAKTKIVPYNKISRNWIGLDLGPKTIEQFNEKINKAKTIFWNGSLGYIEIDEFSKASDEIAKEIAKSKAVTIAGGGDTFVTINKNKLENKFTFVSTGGGASLEFIEGKKLPGIEALK